MTILNKLIIVVDESQKKWIGEFIENRKILLGALLLTTTSDGQPMVFRTKHLTTPIT